MQLLHSKVSNFLASWSVTGDISLYYLLSSLFTGSAGPQASAIVAVVEVVVLIVVLVEILFFFVPSNVILLTQCRF